MSALSELLDTRGDELALLGWVVRYAPDGDEDAALRRAWEAVDEPYELCVMVELVNYGQWPAAMAALYDRVHGRAVVREGCAHGATPVEPIVCPVCAAAVRMVARAPVWADVERLWAA
jgi:hypothetical protein